MTPSATQPLLPSLIPASTTRDIALVVGGSLVVALFAQVTIPLPFVEITGQTLGVFLVALALGSKLGGAALILYLLEALVGLPVLAGFKNAWSVSSAGGVPAIIGPTAGYLLGFVMAAFAVGWLADKGWTRNVLLVSTAMLIGTVLIYIPGLLWLSKFTGARTLEFGLIPFIPGDLIKAALAAVLLPSAWKLTKR